MNQRSIIPGFHPDPSMCAVGGTFYLANSSFEFAPGVPIHASTDLVEWSLIGHALHRPDQLTLTGTGPSGGIFAPTLRHHAGRFWMITTNVGDDLGQLLVWADRADGPWSEAIRIPSIEGIDPDIAWGDDDTCFMTYASRTGIQQVQIDPETGAVLSDPRQLWSGTGGKFPEAPHVFKRGDFWYLLLAEGGTERGHAVTIARSDSPSGPFEGYLSNPILTRRGTGSAVQSTGHADIVRVGTNDWAIVYLAVRPRGSSPEWHVLGRETFASHLTWIDDWPVVGDPIEPAETTSSEALRLGEELPPTWIGNEVFPGSIVTVTAEGWKIPATRDDIDTFIGRRQDRLYASAQATLTTSGSAAFCVRIDDKHQLRLELNGDRLATVFVVGGNRLVLDEREHSTGPELAIRTLPIVGGAFDTTRGPDQLVAGFVENEGFVETGRIDGRYLSTEVAGGMTGRLFGVSVARGTATLTGFRYVGSDDPDQLGSRYPCPDVG